MASIVFYLDDASTQVVRLDGEEVVTIGRHPDSVVVLNNASVSSHHATIKREEKGCYVYDLGSSNGTRLNGAEIEEALLNDGDRVTFGDVQALFHAGAAPADVVAPAPQSVFVPRPDAPLAVEADRVVAAPPPVVPMRSRFSRRAPVRRGVLSGYPDQSGGGCATAIFLTGLFLVAFFIGLTMRHLKETDRSFMGDILDRITKSMPKVKIERE